MGEFFVLNSVGLVILERVLYFSSRQMNFTCFLEDRERALQPEEIVIRINFVSFFLLSNSKFHCLDLSSILMYVKNTRDKNTI